MFINLNLNNLDIVKAIFNLNVKPIRTIIGFVLNLNNI